MIPKQAKRISEARAAAPGEEGFDLNREVFHERPAALRLRSIIDTVNLTATPAQWAQFFALEFAVRNRIAADAALRDETERNCLAALCAQVDTLPLRRVDGTAHRGPLPDNWMGELLLDRDELRAWVAQHDQSFAGSALLGAGATPAPAAAAPRKGGRPPKGAERTALLETALQKLEEFARAERLDFDRQNMPGPLGESWEEKGSFHWFCAQIEREFRVQKRTFARIRAGLCAVKPFASRGGFYMRALRHIAPKMQPAEKQRGAQKT